LNLNTTNQLNIWIMNGSKIEIQSQNI